MTPDRSKKMLPFVGVALVLFLILACIYSMITGDWSWWTEGREK